MVKPVYDLNRHMPSHSHPTSALLRSSMQPTSSTSLSGANPAAPFDVPESTSATSPPLPATTFDILDPQFNFAPPVAPMPTTPYLSNSRTARHASIPGATGHTNSYGSTVGSSYSIQGRRPASGPQQSPYHQGSSLSRSSSLSHHAMTNPEVLGGLPQPNQEQQSQPQPQPQHQHQHQPSPQQQLPAYHSSPPYSPSQNPPQQQQQQQQPPFIQHAPLQSQLPCPPNHQPSQPYEALSPDSLPGIPPYVSRTYPSYTLPALPGPVLTNIASPQSASTSGSSGVGGHNQGNLHLVGPTNESIGPGPAFHSGVAASLSYNQNNPHGLYGMAPQAGGNPSMRSSSISSSFAGLGISGNRAAFSPTNPGAMINGPGGAVSHTSMMERERSERPFKCDVCRQSFNRNHDLKRHKRIHLAVKPFPCSHCDKSFSRKDALKRHMLVKGCGKKIAEGGGNHGSAHGQGGHGNNQENKNVGGVHETTATTSAIG